MLDPEVVGSLVQFGTAGLIGWMWLTERKGSVDRERQLTEAHERLVEQRVGVEALLGAVRENTRVLGQLEAGQRALLELWAREEGRRGRDPGIEGRSAVDARISADGRSSAARAA
jgi:hypothetical protein